ncbi:MAG: helicase-related protein, partial [Longimicrobiales bacterium]
ALAGFKGGHYRLLVATDIVARGIDVEALEHVVNFDVPNVPDDYIHRVGRTARADAIGDAYTFVSPEEENDMRAIERAVGRRIERRKIDGFDYSAKATEKLEVPIGERIAEIRARKSEERARARANADKKASRQASGDASAGSSSRSAPRRRRRGGGGRGGPGSQSSAA